VAATFCFQCNKKLTKVQIALCKKLLSSRIDKFMCIICLAEHLDTTEDVLLDMIEKFKEQGCELFK